MQNMPPSPSPLTEEEAQRQLAVAKQLYGLLLQFGHGPFAPLLNNRKGLRTILSQMNHASHAAELRDRLEHIRQAKAAYVDAMVAVLDVGRARNAYQSLIPNQQDRLLISAEMLPELLISNGICSALRQQSSSQLSVDVDFIEFTRTQLQIRVLLQEDKLPAVLPAHQAAFHCLARAWDVAAPAAQAPLIRAMRTIITQQAPLFQQACHEAASYVARRQGPQDDFFLRTKVRTMASTMTRLTEPDGMQARLADKLLVANGHQLGPNGVRDACMMIIGFGALRNKADHHHGVADGGPDERHSAMQRLSRTLQRWVLHHMERESELHARAVYHLHHARQGFALMPGVMREGLLRIALALLVRVREDGQFFARCDRDALRRFALTVVSYPHPTQHHPDTKDMFLQRYDRMWQRFANRWDPANIPQNVLPYFQQQQQ